MLIRPNACSPPGASSRPRHCASSRRRSRRSRARPWCCRPRPPSNSTPSSHAANGGKARGADSARAHRPAPARACGAPLYRVDIGALMNKYIGETEKNLAALLDHAAGTDAMLLFDEADALFGRRSDGGDTGERFANLLTNYLLTRIESHPGLVVLTSNHRARIDAAFTRRLDAIVEFPLPGPEERLALWLALLGERAPARSDLQHLASYA
ncbi:MAG: ATP-binding protein, partial [Nitrospira sp.]|nr:ATP-binding protein [Nitrospira sp.]